MHKEKEFTFISTTNKAVNVKTKLYNFEIEEYLTKRFGKEKLQSINTENAVDFDIALEDVKKDFPVLLNIPQKVKIDYKTQDYDVILSVYAFFLMYKKNAMLRQLEYNNETVALAIQQAQTILASMPLLTSQMKS